MKEKIQTSAHIKLTYITHFYCDEKNKWRSIEELLNNFASYPAEILDHTHFVIGDDGSPIDYQAQHHGLNITWLRITNDIPWNNPGARNLGVTYAKSENIIISGTDHDLPAETMSHLIHRPNCGKFYYKLKRMDHSGDLQRSLTQTFSSWPALVL